MSEPAPAPGTHGSPAPAKKADIPLGYWFGRQACVGLAGIGAVGLLAGAAGSQADPLLIFGSLILLMNGILGAGIMQIAGLVARDRRGR
jgi:hypothetical protein